MDFARTVLDIPAPKVLSWSGEAENSVESEYILMEEVTGDKLSDVWFQMELDDKLKVVNDVVDLQRKFTSVAFNRYGNLYFAKDAYPGCVKVEITGDLSQSSKDMTNNRFVIGPVVDPTFWLQERASMNIDRGPSQRTPAAHIALYKQFLAVSEYILPRGNQFRATLMHPNYHTDHIYVQKGRITGLVDWHGAWIAPLFLQAECPNLVRYTGELMLEFPEGYSALDDADRLRIRTQAERSILLRVYQTALEKTNPVLHAASQVPQARVRDQIVSFSKYSWDDGILLFRQALIWVARHWDEYNTNIPCPIGFTPEEFAAHLRDGQGFNESQEFWDEIREEWMQPDGWIWNDLYEPTMEYLRVHRKDLLATSTGSELVMMEKILRWIDTKPE
ncbi:phosphotransferase enzyme family [Pyrenophora seminiperda CCB06]|uniref:Altered inheritance of mitochondria protein 9, mitochondrial n=1 Tax=Pyrenophora seminiperda CCB06 TaxID=1302712 RepID=A0A3M7LVA6_9PLEO|nr:phosphotransferase enzyme family [Pyrenophora seminiperda CCB06]